MSGPTIIPPPASAFVYDRTDPNCAGPTDLVLAHRSGASADPQVLSYVDGTTSHGRLLAFAWVHDDPTGDSVLLCRSCVRPIACELLSTPPPPSDYFPLGLQCSVLVREEVPA